MNAAAVPARRTQGRATIAGMTDDDAVEWLPVEDAARRLNVSIRQTQRYGNGENARLRIRRAGRRDMYHAGDVDELAVDLGAARRAKDTSPRTAVAKGEVLPASQVQAQLIEASRNIGYLQGTIEQLQHALDETRRQLDDSAAVRQQLHDAETRIAALEAERDTLRTVLERETPQRQPWWVSLLRRRR